MTVTGFLLLLLAAASMALANLLLKVGIADAGGFNFSPANLLRVLWQPAVIGGLFISVAAAVVWFRVLSTQKLSTCYPIFVSLTYTLITCGAILFLHERVSAQKLLGLLIIVSGIAMVFLGDRP